MYKYRRHYWSNSKLAHWIYEQIKLPKPTAATLEEWDEWENTTYKNKRAVYYVVETGFDFIQDVINYPLDLWNAARSYIRNRFIEQSHVLHTRLPKGKYHENDRRMLHAMFELLVDFVEIEKCNLMYWCHSELKRPWWNKIRSLRFHSPRDPEKGLEYIKWEMDLTENNHFTDQALVAQEIYDLYTWWKDIRPNRPDPYEISGWTAWCKEWRKDESLPAIFGKDPEPKKTRKILDELSRIEREYEKEDDQNLIRLIKIRRNLWS